MSAICGWINVSSNDDDRAAAIASMSAASAPGANGRLGCDATPTGAAISIEGLVPVSRYRRNGLLVVVLGRVRWESPDLGRIASEAGDAAATSHAYATHGADCVLRMKGPFALAVSDDANRRGLLAIDRMAIRSLCYATVAGGVVFGTSPAAVAAHPAVGHRLSMQGIYNYLYCENVPAPGTIYQDVDKLLPGQRVIVDAAGVRADFYWRLDSRHDIAPSEAELRAEFRTLLRDCVSRSLTRQDTGTFLSGGTDSSTVTGILTELRGEAVDTYSIGFEAEGFDEMAYARITSRHFHSRPHEYYATPRDVAEAIPLIAGGYDEPFGNASAVPTYCCARLAKQDGKSLLLAGDGGDEIFGGNARYAKQKIFEWYGVLPAPLRRGIVEPVLFSGAWIDAVPLLRKARSYVQQAKVPLPDRLEAYNFLEREAIADIFEPDFLRAVDPGQPRAIAREVYGRTVSTAPVDRMMHLDLKETLADNDLRKVNGMCGLAGIEVGFPLLDDDLVDFSARLSPSQKVKGLKLRSFFKEALSDFLPPETIAKTKHGFGLPFGLWMASDVTLRQLAGDSLSAFRSRGYVKPAYVDRLLQQHQAAHASYFGVMIWIVMMLEQWLRAHER